MATGDRQDGWSRHELLVTHGLEQVQKEVREIHKKVNEGNLKIFQEIATLRAKSNEQARMWGLIAGAVPSLLLLLLSKLLG